MKQASELLPTVQGIVCIRQTATGLEEHETDRFDEPIGLMFEIDAQRRLESLRYGRQECLRYGSIHDTSSGGLLAASR